MSEDAPRSIFIGVDAVAALDDRDREEACRGELIAREAKLDTLDGVELEAAFVLVPTVGVNDEEVMAKELRDRATREVMSLTSVSSDSTTE